MTISISFMFTWAECSLLFTKISAQLHLTSCMILHCKWFLLQEEGERSFFFEFCLNGGIIYLWYDHCCLPWHFLSSGLLCVLMTSQLVIANVKWFMFIIFHQNMVLKVGWVWWEFLEVLCPSVSLICLSYVYFPFLLLLSPILLNFSIYNRVSHLVSSSNYLLQLQHHCQLLLVLNVSICISLDCFQSGINLCSE